jgi:hypothetical protein
MHRETMLKHLLSEKAGVSLSDTFDYENRPPGRQQFKVPDTTLRLD